MPDIEKDKPAKKDNGQQLQRRDMPSEPVRTEPMREHDPLHMLRELMRWDPFRSDLAMRGPFRVMRDLMQDLMALPMLAGRHELAWRPEFEVHETDDTYVIRADVPGLNAEDLEVSVVADRLQISGRREQKQERGEGTYHAFERSYGSFVRTFDLPDTIDIDKIRCDLSSGVLEIVLPRKQGAAPARRKIEIKAGT